MIELPLSLFLRFRGSLPFSRADAFMLEAHLAGGSLGE